MYGTAMIATLKGDRDAMERELADWVATRGPEVSGFVDARLLFGEDGKTVVIQSDSNLARTTCGWRMTPGRTLGTPSTSPLSSRATRNGSTATGSSPHLRRSVSGDHARRM